MRVVDSIPNAYRASRYPWDDWLQPGRIIELRRGEDFDVLPMSFRATAMQVAHRRRVRAFFRIVESSVFIDTRELP